MPTQTGPFRPSRATSAHPSIFFVGRNLEAWAQRQRAQGNSERTITARAQVVVLFGRHAGVDPADASIEQVIAFLASVRHLSKSTRATYFSHLRAWYRFLHRTGIRADDPTMGLDAPKLPRRRPRPVTDEQLRRLLETKMHRRSRMMVLLAAYQGLRVHEIAKIAGEDVNLLEMELRVIGKGDEDVILPLHPIVAKAATAFPRRGYWFITHTSNTLGQEHILGKSVSDIIANAMTRAEISGGGHRLRHWHATKLIAEGVNTRIVQELMRHQSLNTTQVYCGVTFAQQRAALCLLDLPDQRTPDGVGCAA